MKHTSSLFFHQPALFILLLMAFLCVPAAGMASPKLTVNKIVAVVNGEMVTMHEVRRAAMPDMHKAGLQHDDPRAQEILKRVLDVMIDDLLLRQEGKRLKIEVADVEIDNELRKIIQSSKMSPEQFSQRIALEGNSVDLIKERLRNTILAQRVVTFMVSRKIVVTADAVKEYYEQHRDSFLAEKLVKISVILFQPTINPDDVVRRIKKGEYSFADAARQYSMGPSAQEGGALGTIAWHDLSSDWKSLLEKLQDGEITPVFKADDNFAVMRLDATTFGAALSLEDATPQIEELLRQPLLQERFTEYTKLLRSRAVVDVRL